MKKAANNTSIKVFCRLRPLNRLEKEQGGECCVQHSDKSIKVKVAGSENTNDFTFDTIFGSDCTQMDVFNTVAKPVIDGLFDGYNGTIFAYGQTSSGKTFTMEGPDLIDTEEKLGIIPRMMKYVFSLIMNSSEDIEFNVKVSFLELYNEKLQDLIDPRKNNLQIKEDKAKGIFVQDATEVYVTSAEQMQQVHKSGSENRTIAATRMNERSSRSHSIFVLYVNQKNTKTDTTKHSKLYFVDLAGSEKISKTNVTGQQLEEAKNINKSLTALGLVINALTEKDKGHVPYRDSKLTRLLQESLGGNSQTSLILACSMCSYNDKEIVDTLRFGYRAKSIKNTPIVNAEKSAKELTILLNAAEKRIHDQETLIQNLQQQLSGGVIARPVELMSPRSIETEIKKEEDSSQAEEAKRNQNSKPQKSGASSMTLFKHQMELTNLREQIEELKSSNKDLETELSTKNQEIYDLNGKIMQYEQQISEFSSKNNLAIEEYQVHLEKLYNENQEKTMLTNKFKRAISRLKSDLNFVFLTKHLKSLETGDTSTSTLETTMMTNEKESSRQTNKDELLVNSIQRTIEVLEEVEREIEENEKKTNLNEEMENIIDALMKNSFSNSLIKDNDKSGPPFQFRTDLLAPEAEDDIKAINWMTESSGENKESLGLLDNLKLDGDNDDDFAQKMQMQFQSLSEDDKVNELHALVANQRKMITNLTKLNNELTQANQKHQASNEKNVTLYKSKLEELQKINTDKTKEYDSKIQGLKMLLETKINDLEETKATNDKYLLAKVQMISELKQQNDTLQNLISGNDAALRSFELETTLKEVMVERKKLAEEILKLRREVDEKEDAISKKTTQIESLQDNLGLAAKEIKTLKQFKPANFEMSSAPKESARGPPKTKMEFNLFDKHVVKPIRGGGGDANNFAKNNFFTFDKPNRVDSQPEDKKPIKSEVKTPRSVTFNFNAETPRGAKLLDDQNMRKFDDLLKQKRGSQPALVKPISGLRVQTEIDEEDEVDMVQIQQKLKTITARNVMTTKQQKSTTSFFGNVRNLFS